MAGTRQEHGSNFSCPGKKDKKRHKNVEEGQNILKFGQKCTKLKIFWKRAGDCMQLLHTINC